MTTRQQPLIVCLVIAAALTVAHGETDAEYYARYEKAVKSVIEQADMSSQDLSAWNGASVGTDFNCHIDKDYIPSATNVDELTPYDIKVVGAVGDSITAAFAANSRTVFDLKEFRGVSWSIGGDGDLSTVTTLPNIIKKYNPNVKGFSMGTGNKDSDNAHLNRAVSAAKSDAMYDQAVDLVQKIKDDETINFEKDWKLVTLWIGGNDLCQYCEFGNNPSLDKYAENIKMGLDYLREKLPRTFVNVVQIIDIEKLSEVNNFICEAVHSFVCPCKEKANEMSESYQIALEEMVDQFAVKDDFTVVLQPFMKGVEIPRKEDGSVDMSYFALDCFHFSGKGHSEGAIALWNNMIQAVGSKDKDWDFSNNTILCPSDEKPYFYTRKNSLMLGDSNLQQQQQQHQSGPAVIIAGSLVGVMVVAGALVILAVFVVWRRQRVSEETTPLLDS